MKVTRVYADENGETHFDEINVPLTDAGEIGFLSDRMPVTAVRFRENEPHYDYTWHNAPARQYIVLLDGEIEIEVSDGEKRIFAGGDILLVEDVKGKGHCTRHTAPMRRRSVFIEI